MTKNVSATELLPVMTAELAGNRREVWLNKNIQTETDEDGNTVWTADTVQFATELTAEEVTARFDELWEEQTVPKPTIADVVDGLNALAEMLMM